MEYVSGNQYIRTPLVNKRAGAARSWHAHDFDHTMVVMAGAARIDVRQEGGTIRNTVLRAADMIENPPRNALPVPAKTEHMVTALEDGTTVWCLFSLRNAHGEVVEDRQEMVWNFG